MDSENKEKLTNSEFLERYEAIAARQLMPENADDYAEKALKDLIALTDDILEKHKWDELSGKDWEDAAFKEEGLPNLAEKLDHVGKEAEVMHIIEERLEKLIEEPYEILRLDGEETGPNPTPTPIPTPHEIHPSLNPKQKTKIILFVLNQRFGEDIGESGPIKIEKGKKSRSANNPKWTRTYYCIDAPNQNKYILSCDKIGNKTFVIDKDDLSMLRDEDGQPISIDEIKKMTKNQVNTMIKTPGSMPRSTRVNLSRNFAANITRAIANQPQLSEDAPTTENCFIE